jgi:hypothetical protein
VARTSVNIVDAQVAAYNAHDLETFLDCYTAQAEIIDWPDRIRARGRGEMRDAYGRLFQENPSLLATIENRILQGRFVIDHERVTGRASGRETLFVVIYETVDDAISKVWIVGPGT